MSEQPEFRDISEDIDRYMADPLIRAEVEQGRAEMADADRNSPGS